MGTSTIAEERSDARPIPKKYPARSHLSKTSKLLSEPLKSNFIFLKGSSSIPRGSSDQFYAFDQESNFYFLTGSEEPDHILLYDIRNGRSVLFIPPLRTGRDVVYLGQRMSITEAMQVFDIDKASYHNEVGSDLIELVGGLFYTLNDKDLVDALTKARCSKDQYEVDAIRRANEVTCAAHMYVARGLQRYKTETEVHAAFLQQCRIKGSKRQAYAPIVGSGENASVLHYSSNDEAFGKRELVLIDAACEMSRYATDVTRTYPISGKFSSKASVIYSIVLDIQERLIEMVKPGVTFADLNGEAHRILAKKCIQQGFLNCELATAIDLKLTTAFLPHGFGHHIGLDVHDVTPLIPSISIGQSSETLPLTTYFGNLLSNPKLTVAPLEQGNIITVEPGFYFNKEWLDTFYNDQEKGKYYNKKQIASHVSLGGVRIEDVILVTADGYKNLTNLAKTIDDIEKLMSSHT